MSGTQVKSAGFIVTISVAMPRGDHGSQLPNLPAGKREAALPWAPLWQQAAAPGALSSDTALIKPTLSPPLFPEESFLPFTSQPKTTKHRGHTAAAPAQNHTGVKNMSVFNDPRFCKTH